MTYSIIVCIVYLHKDTLTKDIFMTVQDLLIKVQKAEETVSKREATLMKQIKREMKLRKVLIDKGLDITDSDLSFNYKDNIDLYWEICDWESSKETVENSKKVLEEKIKVLKKWKERLNDAQMKERNWNNEIPETMKTMKDELVKRWDEYDLTKQKRLGDIYKELGHDKFFIEYSYSAYQLIHKPFNEIHDNNMKAAEELIMNLYNRIYAITGDVTNWGDIYYNNGALNGVVYGKLGNVKVESILAGGYNIQRLHVRVLVHEI